VCHFGNMGIFNLGVCVHAVKLVGLAGFEPASIAPEATSLDQASRQPLLVCLRLYVHLEVTKISIPKSLQNFLD
jgi:hypothetical protein